LHAAGFDPAKMRERSVGDKEKIIEKLCALHKKHLPALRCIRHGESSQAFSAALRQYSSWAKALAAAGVTKKPRTKKIYKGRLSLLNALQ
jgi:hypothetical protein